MQLNLYHVQALTNHSRPIIGTCQFRPIRFATNVLLVFSYNNTSITYSLANPGIDVPVTEHTSGFALNSETNTWNCIWAVEYSSGAKAISMSTLFPPQINPGQKKVD